MTYDVIVSPKDQETVQLAFRLPAQMIERIDAHVERMNADSKHPGVTFTRADAVRSLLTRALDAVEGAGKSSNAK